MHDHVVEAVVGVDDGGLVVFRGGARQPLDQPLHLFQVDRLGRLVLLGPARDLALHVVAFAAEALKAYRAIVRVVKIGEGLARRHMDRMAFRRGVVGQGLVPKDAALDHVHDVEDGADHLFVRTQTVRLRYGKAGGIEGRDDAELAVDGVGRGQQLARRLAPHDVLPGGRDELVGRVRLAPLELTDLQRPLVPGDVGASSIRQAAFSSNLWLSTTSFTPVFNELAFALRGHGFLRHALLP